MAAHTAGVASSSAASARGTTFKSIYAYPESLLQGLGVSVRELGSGQGKEGDGEEHREGIEPDDVEDEHPDEDGDERDDGEEEEEEEVLLQRMRSGEEEEAIGFVVKSGNRIVFTKPDTPDSGLAVWRSLLFSSRERTEDVPPAEVVERLLHIRRSVDKVWVVLLASGGHFAGTVFKPQAKGGAMTVVAKRTFHRYVVRAKAGGRQAAQDATGKMPKSAGSSLRRYNELALQQEIRDLLVSWTSYLHEATRVWVYAPGSTNSKTLFGFEGAPIRHNDHSVRRVPFPVRRPTVKETQRVMFHCSAIEEGAMTALFPEADIERKKEKERQQMVEEAAKRKEQEEEARRRHREEMERKEEELRAFQAQLAAEPAPPLAAAAMAGDGDAIRTLLSEGNDPSQPWKGKVPYLWAAHNGHKHATDEFRRWMAKFPDMYDWKAACVPSPLTDEMEERQAAKAAEKKAKQRARQKELKKLRKEQDKEEALRKEAEEARKREEEEARKRKAKLGKAANKKTDRELRAEAAERRLKAMQNGL